MGGPRARRWLVAGVIGASLVFAALASLTALATPPFSSADEAQHASYALDVADGTLPLISTPVRSRIPGMPGLPAGCVVTPDRAKAGLAAARATWLDDSRQRPVPNSVAREIAAAPGMPDCARDLIRSNTALTYTANHPPLFYGLQAVPLTIGIDHGHPIGGFRAARLLNVAIGVAALVAVAWLVRELVPTRPDLAVATAALLGTVGMFVNSSAQLYNDALAVCTIIAALAATVALLRRGGSPARLACFGCAVLAATATRASGLLAAAVLLPAAGLAVTLHTARFPRATRPRRQAAPRADGHTDPGNPETERSASRREAGGLDETNAPVLAPPADTAAGAPVGWRRRIGYGVATAAGGAALVAGGIGWWYWRNVRLYGDPTASGLIARMFPIEEEPLSSGEVLTSRTFWWAIYRGFFGRPRLLVADGRDLTQIPKIILWVLATGLALAVLRRVARWCAARWAARRPRPDRPAGWTATSRAREPDVSTTTSTMASTMTRPSPVSPDTARVRPREARTWRTAAAPAAAWLVTALHVAVVVATLIGYVASGGAWFARYLLPGLPVAALLLAIALGALPGARRGLPTVLAVLALAGTCVLMSEREIAFKHQALRPLGVRDRFESALTMSGFGAPTTILWILGTAAAAGFALLATAMWFLSSGAVPRWPLPSLTPRRRVPAPYRPSLAEALAADRPPGLGRPGGATRRESPDPAADADGQPPRTAVRAL
ncbi:hypothetical protein I6A84_36865 [Frankia sp. CNm7]|uniref:Glycosyltransferase RgtA/B/C/D-like domain-containing protein n=2 Tax=Frankia nepalensis TaxID=1836974 RepID=A0A937RDK3_9ACTN|nr:hypothetical protein [Frankia nepalensis]MBL7496832.1 hypothetical protein [Frankia nepalensis]MBL7510957.1 hypothetical protein [Frankia nepalensis]MBL7523482.1 hypothetical protein [Frankia nepalensis]MBL7626914.1 hypothetical protein [Frankia nepalensis]